MKVWMEKDRQSERQRNEIDTEWERQRQTDRERERERERDREINAETKSTILSKPTSASESHHQGSNSKCQSATWKYC